MTARFRRRLSARLLQPPVDRSGCRRRSPLRDLDFYYGQHQALKNINLRSAANRGHGVDRPVGLRQVHAAAHLQPHLRAVSRPARRRARCCWTAEHPRPRARSSTGCARKVGMVFQKPTPFPMTIYENIAFGIRLHEKLSKAEMDDRVEQALRRRRACGTRSRTSSMRARSASPAASSSACASRAPSRCGPR